MATKDGNRPKQLQNLVRRKRPKQTKQLYELILNAYRENPGVHRAVERETKYDRRAAKLLWEKGWPHKTWAKPIKDVLGEELDDVRAEALRKAQAARDLDDAAAEAKRGAWKREIEEEVYMMTSVRQNVLGMSAVVQGMQQGVLQLSRIVIGSVLDADGKPLANPKVKPVEAMKILRDVATMVGRLAYSEQVVVDLGRLVRGEAPGGAASTPKEMDDDSLRENLKLIEELRKELDIEASREPADPTALH